MMVNYGTTKSPQWRCRPCHNSVRALERAASSTGEQAQIRLRAIKLDEKEFAYLALSFRVKLDGEDNWAGEKLNDVTQNSRRGKIQLVMKRWQV